MFGFRFSIMIDTIIAGHLDADKEDLNEQFDINLIMG